MKEVGGTAAATVSSLEGEGLVMQLKAAAPSNFPLFHGLEEDDECQGCSTNERLQKHSSWQEGLGRRLGFAGFEWLLVGPSLVRGENQ